MGRAEETRRGRKGQLMPKVSVVVLNWNGAHLLPDCLDSVRRQTFQDIEIIMPDNGSTDGSLALVEERYPEVEVVRFSTNLGFSLAVNEGIRRSRGEFIALLNNDTELDSRYLAELVAAMKEDPSLGMCAPKMVYYDDPSLINSAGHACGPDGVVVDIGRRQPNDAWFEQPREVLGACAGAALYRRAMLEEIGLFDPDFFISFEDADLNWRAQWAGWRARYVPSAVIKHREGVSREIRSPRAIFLGLRNTAHVWAKDWPTGPLIRRLPALWQGWRRDTAALMRRGFARTVAAAVLASLVRLPRMLNRRRAILAGRRVSGERFEALLAMGERQTRVPPED
jgi:GT2 family glycosyltransferase